MTACWSYHGISTVSKGSEICSPSGVSGKNSASIPVFTHNPSEAASETSRRSTFRGAGATSSPSETQLAVTQATSGFHGSWITAAAPGTASMSGCAGSRR